MNLVPKGLSRAASRQLLKLNANSPTILVVAGVVGFGATAVMAAKATRKIDPVVEQHNKTRAELANISYTSKRVEQQDLLRLYTRTVVDFTKVYGPTVVVGTLSTASVLYGHKILRGRHVATMAAYSGLLEQFQAYRKRVATTLGETAEHDIYHGAVGERTTNERGESELGPSFKDAAPASYLQPWFDETNPNYTSHPEANFLFLKGVQAHMNRVLDIRGHVFLNDVFDALGMPRCREGAVAGWVRGNPDSDGFIDFGFMTSNHPASVAFRNFADPIVRLNFNIDGIVWDKI